MNYYSRAFTQTKCRLHNAVAIVATVVLLLSGCGNSSETPESESSGMNNSTNTNNPTEDNADFSAEIIDPAGAIAELTFLSAEEDALYQCILSGATASARSRGLQAYPVIAEADPLRDQGIHATWCKTVDTGAAVDADIASCKQHLNSGQDISAPGTEALRLFANIQRGTSNLVDWFELRSINIPTVGSSDFKVVYQTRRQREIGDDWFGIHFIPLDGNSYNEDLSVFIANAYTHVDQEVGLNAFYTPNDTTAERKSLLTNSAAQLKAITTADYEALKVQVEQELNANSALDADTRQAALDKATTELDQVISMIDQHGETFHRLLLEQLLLRIAGNIHQAQDGIAMPGN